VLSYESLSSHVFIYKKNKERKKKRNINIDLAILPSHNIKKYIESCNIYQRNKNHIEKPVEKLILNAVLEKP